MARMFNNSDTYTPQEPSTMSEFHLLNTVRHTAIPEDRKNDCKRELIRRWMEEKLDVHLKIVDTSAKAPVEDTLVESIVKSITS